MWEIKIINKWKNSAEFKNTNFGVFQAESHSNEKAYFVLIRVYILFGVHSKTFCE